MRILIANDKFKGSLSASEVAQTIQTALGEVLPEAEVDLCPIADGGEGTAEAMITALGGTWLTQDVMDARERPIVARYGWIRDKREAVMEMSAASGLALVTDLPLEPEMATTFGTGQLIDAALRRGAQRIVIGIGGSATNDGGLGMAAALGYRFLDDVGQIVAPLMREVPRIARIEPPDQIWDAAMLVACDVDNPLLGSRGATQIFGPQKGVRDMEYFEQRLTHLAERVTADLGRDPREVPGAGAAGGLGFGLMAFCGATLTGGFDLVAEQLGLMQRISQADMVITGEGRLDGQTLCGKGPVGVARMARSMGKRIVAVAGSIEDTPALRQEFDLALAIKPDHMPLAEAMERTAALIGVAVHNHRPQIRTLLGLA